MTDERKKHLALKFWELIDEVILAGALFPLIKGLAVKGAEKLGKKAEEKFGFGSLDDAKKSVEDNILYGAACLKGLSDDEISDLKDFEKKLKQEENGPDKVQALVLYIVKGIIFFKSETTKSKGGGKPKGKDDDPDSSPKETTRRVDYSEGFAWAVKFLRQLLSHVSFEERVAFLEHEEVFSLIPKKKETIDILKKAKEFFFFGKEKFADHLESEGLNFSGDCEKFKNWAKKFYESSKGGKK